MKLRFHLLLLSLIAVLCACGGDRGQRPTVRDTAPTLAATTVGAGDEFDVNVHGEEDMTGRYRVADDGTIYFPLVGEIQVAGLLPRDVGRRIEDALRDGRYLVDPHVRVLVQEYNSKRLFVLGAVSEPGTFPATPGMTVLQAISLAGGYTALADRNATVVTREEDGELVRFEVRGADMMEGRAADFPVRPGDRVFVPERIF